MTCSLCRLLSVLPDKRRAFAMTYAAAHHDRGLPEPMCETCSGEMGRAMREMAETPVGSDRQTTTERGRA